MATILWARGSTWIWPSPKANYRISAESGNRYPEKGDVIVAVWKGIGRESVLRIETRLTGVAVEGPAVVQTEAADTTHTHASILARVRDPLPLEDAVIHVPDLHHPDAVDRVRQDTADPLLPKGDILALLGALLDALLAAPRATVLSPRRKERAPRLRDRIRARIHHTNPAGMNHPRPTLHPITLVSLPLPILAVLLP